MKIALEGKDQVIDVPDGATAETIETEARKYYTPEELSGQSPLSGGYQLEEQSLEKPKDIQTFDLPTTFAEREDYRIRRGRSVVDVGKAGWRAMEGGITDDEARKIKTDTMKDFTQENDKKFAADNWTERIVGATTELAPYMLDSSIEGVRYGEIFGAAGAGAALLAGQAGPQALLPEEIITAPVAYLGGKMVGQVWGAWRNAAMVEGGSIYMDLLDDDVDKNTARAWAIPAGYLIGALELLQVGQLFNRWIPGLGKKGITTAIKRMASKKASAGIAKTMAKMGLTFSKEMALHTAFEIAEEEAQEVVSLMAELGANVIQDEADSEGYRGPDFDEAKMRLAETFKQGLLGFPLLGLPGSVYTTFQIHGREKMVNRIMTQKAKESLNLDLADQIAEATKFDNLKDFQDSLDEKVDDKFANQYGFDNRTLFIEGVWNASRDVKGEDKTIEDIVSEEIKKGKEQHDLVQKGDIEKGTLSTIRPDLTDTGTIIISRGYYNMLTGQGKGHKKIVEKHLGVNLTQEQYDLLSELINRGKVIEEKPGALIIQYPNNPLIRDVIAAVSKPKNKNGEVLSMYERPAVKKLGAPDAGQSADSGDSNVPSKLSATTNQSISQDNKNVKSELMSKEQSKGRVNKLIEDSNDLLKQIDSLERQKVRLEKAGKPVVALDAEIGKLAEQYNAMDSEIANIMTSDSVNLSEEKIQLKARELEAIEKKIKQAAKTEEKANQKALQKEKMAKIAETKQMLVDYANENLPTSERGAFLNAVMNVKTKKQLDEQIARVNEYAEKAGKRGLVRQIKQQVKRIAKSKSISIDYVQKIQDFIDNYELKGHNEDTIKSLEATKAFI